jgi:hypothetical protein
MCAPLRMSVYLFDDHRSSTSQAWAYAEDQLSTTHPINPKGIVDTNGAHVVDAC